MSEQTQEQIITEEQSLELTNVPESLVGEVNDYIMACMVDAVNAKQSERLISIGLGASLAVTTAIVAVCRKRELGIPYPTFKVAYDTEHLIKLVNHVVVPDSFPNLGVAHEISYDSSEVPTADINPDLDSWFSNLELPSLEPTLKSDEGGFAEAVTEANKNIVNEWLEVNNLEANDVRIDAILNVLNGAITAMPAEVLDKLDVTTTQALARVTLGTQGNDIWEGVVEMHPDEDITTDAGVSYTEPAVTVEDVKANVVDDVDPMDMTRGRVREIMEDALLKASKNLDEALGDFKENFKPDLSNHDPVKGVVVDDAGDPVKAKGMPAVSKGVKTFLKTLAVIGGIAAAAYVGNKLLSSDGEEDIVVVDLDNAL